MNDITVLAPIGPKEAPWQRATEKRFRSEGEATVFANTFVGMPYQLVKVFSVRQAIELLNDDNQKLQRSIYNDQRRNKTEPTRFSKSVRRSI